MIAIRTAASRALAGENPVGRSVADTGKALAFHEERVFDKALTLEGRAGPARGEELLLAALLGEGRRAGEHLEFVRTGEALWGSSPKTTARGGVRQGRRPESWRRAPSRSRVSMSSAMRLLYWAMRRPKVIISLSKERTRRTRGSITPGSVVSGRAAAMSSSRR
jgi:hypothetical protein